MTEMQILYQTLIRASAIIAYAFLYALGGRNQKLWRRIGSPLVFICFMLFIAPITWKTMSLLALSLPLWMGYGRKDVRRVIYALFSASVGGALCLVYGNPWMACFQFVLTLSSTIYLGLINPVVAVKEEFLIALLSVVVLAYTI